MIRSFLAAASAATLLVGVVVSASAQSPAAPGTPQAKSRSGVNVGSLTCNVAGGMGFVFGFGSGDGTGTIADLFKKGKPGSNAPKDDDGALGFWENDAIQLCAQALLVEESQNFTIPSGIIYYAGSKARVDVPFDEVLRARTLEAIALIRDLAARDVPPEPLPAELRHRCFGCSLAPVCLPEETLYLIHQPPTDEKSSAAPIASALVILVVGVVLTGRALSAL